MAHRKWYRKLVETDDILAMVGRLLLSAIFLASAFGKITNFEATIRYMDAHGIPWAAALCATAAALEVLGGVSLLLGFQTRLGALGLAAFLIMTTWIFHRGPEQRIHLLKNIAILGGLMQVAAFGSGAMSLEGRRRSS